MRSDAIVYLMYHEMEVDGRPLCQSEQGYVRYVVRESSFREQMNWLQSAGFRGVSVSDGLENKVTPGVVLTFDDGCETDLTIAAPILHSLNFGATFYITLGFLGRPGYMVARQVRELSEAGFEIGCHSMTHPYLNDLSEAQLAREIAEPKARLEEIVGRPVHHFSCPGGRWSPTVAAVARQAGYKTVATSRIDANTPRTDPFQLARVVVKRDATLRSFQRQCRREGLWQLRFLTSLRTTSHRLLGNALYDRLRSLILERRV
ncbi:MAG: polysaccharide deacetylase family protein [Candidatus Sulfotelmatobacter sp.]|jgi:peptidoglycan/xylan/chitin deacetylase (PgdA/CDA1 family)